MMLRSIEMLRSAPPAVSAVLGDVDRSSCSSVFLPALLLHVPTMDKMMIAGVVLPIKSPARSRIEMSARKEADVAVQHGGACPGSGLHRALRDPDRV